MKNINEKLVSLRGYKPEDFGVQIKFCLDEETLKLQKQILREKQEEKNNQKENKEKMNKKIEKIAIISETNEDEEADENEEKNKEEKANENNEIKTNSTEEKKEEKKIDKMEDKKEVKDNKRNEENSMYLLEKLDDNILYDQSPLLSSFIQIRNTVNMFNSKQLLYPKLHNNLRDTIALKDEKINFKAGKLPLPYNNAITLMKSIKKFKTPFEKIVLIAAISDQITESCSKFWEEMEQYIKKDFLSIEADEIMSIFLYIIIKCQMPEIIIYTKLINNFTTPATQAFNISYNYALLQSTLEYLQSEQTNKLLKTERKLVDCGKTLAAFTSKRLSSVHTGNGVLGI